MKQKLSYLFTFLALVLFSCTHKAIKVDIVRQSSHLLHCDKVFASSLDAIEKENEILVQTGTVDTTDEHAPIPTAIVHVGNREIVLTLIKSGITAGYFQETYSGMGYSLVLSYKQEESSNGDLFYTGDFLIKKGELQSRYDMEGKKSNL